MKPNLPDTQPEPRTAVLQNLWWGIPLFLFIFTCFVPPRACAQGYREWRDTTLPEMRSPRRLGFPGQPRFPVGLFVYDYDDNRPYSEMRDYLNTTGIDHLLLKVHKDYDGQRQLDPWLRYLDLLDTLEAAGKRIVPLPDYGGHDNLPSYVTEAEWGREVIFYPFDSSQMRRWGVYENVFTVYDYDSLLLNPEYANPDSNTAPREAFYDTGLANQTVASGIAFNYKAGQAGRWDQYYDAGGWKATPDPVNSTALFEHINYAGWNAADNKWEGDRFHTHRSPHYIAVTGHLFEGGGASDADTLLRINVWYEVDRNKTYFDSSGSLNIADTNLRFLYKTVGVTRGELKPLNPSEPNWNEYREAIKRVSFEQEGMGGATHEGATAQRFDLEVIYLGGETLALRSVAVRDSISNLLLDQETAGDAYRGNIRRELDTLLRYGFSPDSALRPAIYNLKISDEPYYTQYAGFRSAKNYVEQNFAVGADTLGSLNGAAVPFIQWLGDADWLTELTYIGHQYYNHGAPFHFPPESGSNRYQDVPSVKQHNGGKWGIPELFDFDSLDSAPYAAGVAARVDTMEMIWQHTRMGAPLPGQQIGNDIWQFRLWKVRSMYENAVMMRQLGRPYLSFLGPTSYFKIFFNDATNTYDTIANHRFERSELRGLMRLVLAYGARGITFYGLRTWPGMNYDKETGGVRDTTHILGEQETGLCGYNIADTAYNIIDWTLRNMGKDTVINYEVFYDSIGVIPGMYFGYRNTHRELQESVAWLQRIGPLMSRLLWRDAYSIHFQADLPGNPYDNLPEISHRPLPSDEIIAEVKAWHPVTGAVDPAWATYVELGLFETKVDTTGGVHNRLKDTNYVMVVNRRVFETGNYDTADIAYSPGVKALLDTLSGTRTIRLQLNLHHPIQDSVQYEQYAFLRVREVFPDTAIALPLIGKRAPLDTIVQADSACLITLGCGRSAMLEITYKEPDRSIAVAGDLLFPGQRKFLWDGNRYHACYTRNDSVFYRRSMPLVGDDGGNTGSILWHEPVLVSDPAIPDNYTPSLTFRTAKGDTVVSIVWTRHRDDTTRQVVLRQIGTKGGGYLMDGIEQVSWHFGTNPWQWGTPVVCRLHGADMFAWSDSVTGIHRVARVLDTTGTLWWRKTAPAVYSQGGQIFPSQGIWGPGQYPSLPPFAHVAGQDSNCALVWQQPMSAGGTVIYYARLRHWVNQFGTQLSGAMNYGQLSPVPGSNFYPSICQTQDTIHRLQDGVAWSSTDIRFRTLGGQSRPYFVSAVNFRSIWTDLSESYTGGGDTVRNSQFWGYARYLLDSSTLVLPSGYPFANTTWVEQKYVGSPFTDSIAFSVTFNRLTVPQVMQQGPIRYSAESFAQGINDYAYGGERAHGAAAPFRIPMRHAVLYRMGGGLSARLQTTRQFFAKERPTGYTATGREVYYRTSLSTDTVQTGIMAVLHDAWIADDEGGEPLHFRERGPTSTFVDSVPQVNDLFRTQYFHASDSTMVGCRFTAWYTGEADYGDDALVNFVLELCDSATGLAIIPLDSVEITAARADTHFVELTPEFDLLSGTYFLRLRADVQNVSVDVPGYDSRFVVAELAEYIPAPVSAKYARRLDGAVSSGARISAQPNPFGRRTEVRFSLPHQDYITVTLYNALGRKVEELVERELYSAGRYAVELDGRGLPSGTYMVELCTGTEHLVEKVVLAR